MIKSYLSKSILPEKLMSFITLFFCFISNALKSIINVSVFKESSLTLIDTCGIAVIVYAVKMRIGLFPSNNFSRTIELSGINPLIAIVSRLRRIQQLFKLPIICTKYFLGGMVAVCLFLWLHHVF